MPQITSSLPRIRFWGLLTLSVAILLKTAQWAIFDLSVALGFITERANLEGVLIDWGMPLVNGALFLTIAGWLPCTRRNLWWLTGVGLVVMGVLLGYGQRQYVWYVAYLLAALPLVYFLLFKAIVAWWQMRRYNDMLPDWVLAFFWLTVISTSLNVAAATWLKLSGVLFPATHDLYAHKLELAYGNLAYQISSYYLTIPTWLTELTKFTYATLAALFIPLLALLYREGKANTLHGWPMLLVPFFVGWVCYAWLPISGPIYLFHGVFPDGVIHPTEIVPGLSPVVTAPRNAMPSMHLSGALFILMITAALRRKWLFALATLFVVGTAWATLALGEHYVVDLVVALPFAPAFVLWLMNPPRWQQAPRWQHVLHWTATVTFIGWMLLLRLTPEWLLVNLFFVQVFSISSVIIGLWLLGIQVRCVWREEDTNEALLAQRNPALIPKPFVAPFLLPAELAGRRWLVGIFFFSGFAGLVYEVVYAKALGVTFGGTALAANTVLMTYMGGMALGAWLGGILAERTDRPLVLYAYFEAAIGLYAAITPALFAGIQGLYVAMALDAPPDAAWLTALRMGLGATVLGVPTVLMGATLPLVFKCLQGMGIPTGRAIAPLYAANVLGAALGALLAGYALLPAVGRNGGTMLAAVVSLMIALFVIEKIKRGAESGEGYTSEANGVTQNPSSPSLSPPGARAGLAALAVLTIGGVVTLALEVVFMHLLAVVAGNSVYAFGLMLSTFLLGLGLGSTVGEGLMRRYSRISLVLLAQCGVALAILVTSFVWDSLADYMGSFVYAQQQGVYLSFSARELIRALVCALAMLPPAFFIGLSYPAAMGLAADWLAARRFAGQATRGVGLASALNTLGNIAGVLLAAFWWLPQYGSNRVLLGLAVVAVLLAAWVAWSAGGVVRRWQWLPVGSMAAGLLLFPAQWNYTALSTGGNVYFYPQAWGEVIDHAESVEGGMTTVARVSDGRHLTLLTNGKFQGNNAEGGEMVAQESFALIPLMHTVERGNALVIGYGTGMTARVLQDQGFAHLDVAETSRDIVAMADKHFANINAHISSHPAVRMHYTDGRNYLLTQSRQYDLISLEISSIWFAGAANLYNREFYELANTRLRPQGVLQQWVQLHHMRPMDFLYIMGSVRSVFKYVWVYVSGGQGIVVASNDEAAFYNERALDRLMHSHTISALKLSELPQKLMAGPQQVDALIARFDPQLRFLVSTDKNLYLEYATPKGNAMREDSMPILIDLLRSAGL